MTVFALPSKDLQERLFSHFIDCSPTWITSIRVTEGAEIMHHILLAAMRNSLIRQCVLTLAIGDLCKVQNESSGLQDLSYEYYRLAIANLSGAITEEIKSVSGGKAYSSGMSSSGSNPLHQMLRSVEDDTLLAVLLLCVHEVGLPWPVYIVGSHTDPVQAVNFTSSDRLLAHINGATTLLTHCLHTTPESAELRGFLLELFCYFFALAASTHGSRMSLDTLFANELFHSPFLKRHQSRGMLLGNSPELFLIIIRISTVLQRTEDWYANQDTIIAELEYIERDLWQVAIESSSSDGRSEIVLISELYYVACQLQLKKAMQPNLTPDDTLVQDFVQSFASALEQLPAESAANGVLCWPLFVVGLCTVNGKHRALLTTRLKAIHKGWRCGIPLQISKYLTRKWKENNGGSLDMVLAATHGWATGQLPVIPV